MGDAGGASGPGRKMAPVNVCTMNNELLNLANWERPKEKFKMFMTFLFTSLLFNFL